MLVSIVINTLTSCIELRPADPNAIPEETDLWKQAYEEVIRQTYTECETTKPNEYKHYGRYGLYDFDQDDVPELFLEVYGSTMPDCFIHVYDFVGNELVQLDAIQSGHAWIYGINEPNAVLYGYTGLGGVQGWTILWYENGEFQSERLTEYYPGGSPWCEPQENPLPKWGYEIINIESYNLDDLSGVEIYNQGIKEPGEENE